MTAPNSLITTRFDATSTAEDVVAGLDLSSVCAIVTGASSCIGLETARALASAGAEVTLAVRNTDAGAKAAEDIAKSTRNERVRVATLDLANQASVATFVQNWNGPLHLLINNAGVIPSTLSRTAEGWELQFATNYLGHFALSLGLHDALAVGARERGEPLRIEQENEKRETSLLYRCADSLRGRLPDVLSPCLTSFFSCSLCLFSSLGHGASEMLWGSFLFHSSPAFTCPRAVRQQEQRFPDPVLRHRCKKCQSAHG